MSRIIGKINEEVRRKTARRCKEKGVILPTFKQLRNPELIPQEIKDKLQPIGLWDINPLNLFRITWKNDIKTGLFGGVNYLEIPNELTGIKARVIGLVGKYFPTGAHKVGAAYGCLAPRLVTGEFDPTYHKAVWPSTGNYCRGGTFDSALLGVHAIAILPEEMSQERFDWLRQIGAEVIATPGCESNVKEIYDKCHELGADPQNLILNQFAEFGNPLWHYHVTAPAMEEVFNGLKGDKKNFAAYVSATGSAGTIGAGDYLRELYPLLKVVATEAAECPTLLNNGFGGHRIEGIGDKHVPWVHNVRNTDAVAAIRDEDCMRLFRLFNEPAGLEYIRSLGVSDETASDLSLLGISSICNLLASIKTAKYFDLTEDDIVFTIFTDAANMYDSRLVELNEQRGVYTSALAAIDFNVCLLSQTYDDFLELSYQDKKRIHNLKYYTWVEQQGKTYEEILEQWSPEYWKNIFDNNVERLDSLIEEFNALIEKS